MAKGAYDGSGGFDNGRGGTEGPDRDGQTDSRDNALNEWKSQTSNASEQGTNRGLGGGVSGTSTGSGYGRPGGNGLLSSGNSGQQMGGRQLSQPEIRERIGTFRDTVHDRTGQRAAEDGSKVVPFFSPVVNAISSIVDTFGGYTPLEERARNYADELYDEGSGGDLADLVTGGLGKVSPVLGGVGGVTQAILGTKAVRDAYPVAFSNRESPDEARQRFRSSDGLTSDTAVSSPGLLVKGAPQNTGGKSEKETGQAKDFSGYVMDYGIHDPFNPKYNPDGHEDAWKKRGLLQRGGKYT